MKIVSAARKMLLVLVVFLVSGVTAHAAEQLGPNLIANPSFENGSSGTPTGWFRGDWGDLSVSYAYPVAGRTGNAASLTISAISSGDAKWAHIPVDVTPGAKYRYSDYFKSSVRSEFVVEYTLSNGTKNYVYLGETPSTDAWETLSFDFTVPNGVIKASVFHLIDQVGTLVLDDVSLREVTTTAPVPGSGIVSLSFDDAWKSQYTNALPILESAGIKATFYITTSHLAPGFSGFMKNADVIDIFRKGHEIGGHTVTHVDLTTVGTTKIRQEVTKSKADLEALIGKGKVVSFAYPYGSYNTKVINELKAAKYRNARTTDLGLNGANTANFKIRSISPTIHTPLSEVKAAIDDAIVHDQWLVIAFHEIDTNGNEYSNTPGYLEEIITYLKQTQVKVVPVSEGLKLVK